MARRRRGRGPSGRRRPPTAPRADYDSPWKEAPDHDFERCIAFFFPRVHADIDWARGFEMLDKELQRIVRRSRHGRQYVDKLVRACASITLTIPRGQEVHGRLLPFPSFPSLPSVPV